MAMQLTQLDLHSLCDRLLCHLRDGTTDLAESTYRIDTAQYTDPQRFDREVDTFFRRSPLVLALSAEIPDPGSFKVVEIGDTSVVVSRSQDGSVGAFLNVCRHRGARVVTEERGCARRHSCPYHNWTYDTSGTLVGVPAQDTFGAVDMSDHGLVRLPTEERDGLVWAALAADADLDVAAHLGPLGDELAALRLADLHYGTSRRLEAGNWKLAMDTYLETYHISTLHKNTFALVTTTNITAVDIYGPHQRMVVPRKAMIGMDVIPEDVDPLGLMSLNYLIYPNTILLVTPEAVMLSSIFPGRTVDHSITVQDHFTRGKLGDPEVERAFLARVDMVHTAVANEDYWVQGTVQEGFASGANSHFTFGRNELQLHHFHAAIDRDLDAQQSTQLV